MGWVEKWTSSVQAPPRVINLVMIMHEGYEVACLTERLDLIDQCIDLLNDQWPRSKTARLRSLEQCQSGRLPMSVLLIDKSNGSDVVVGHSKITPVPSSSTDCFVESVVISKSLRGKGLGRKLMEATEKYVQQIGISVVHLTTYDQQQFYERLGYRLSEPITIFGGISPALQKLMEYNEKVAATTNNELGNSCKLSTPVSPEDKKSAMNGSPAPPPPPPPGPPVIVKLNPEQTKKVSMKKCLL